MHLPSVQNDPLYPAEHPSGQDPLTLLHWDWLRQLPQDSEQFMPYCPLPHSIFKVKPHIN